MNLDFDSDIHFNLELDFDLDFDLHPDMAFTFASSCTPLHIIPEQREWGEGKRRGLGKDCYRIDIV